MASDNNNRYEKTQTILAAEELKFLQVDEATGVVSGFQHSSFTSLFFYSRT